MEPPLKQADFNNVVTGTIFAAIMILVPPATQKSI